MGPEHIINLGSFVQKLLFSWCGILSIKSIPLLSDYTQMEFGVFLLVCLEDSQASASPRFSLLQDTVSEPVALPHDGLQPRPSTQDSL